jgi:hypothetical protein
MLPNYNIPTDMQAPFHPSAFSPAPWSALPHQPTTAHRPMQAIQCTTAAAPLSSSESRESGRGRWWRWRNRLPACGNNRLPIASAAARPLSDRGGGESSFPHQGTPCQRTALSPTRVPLASAQRARHPPDGARYGAAPAYSARYGAPSAYSAHYSAERSAPSTSASSAMRTYMPFSISIK